MATKVLQTTQDYTKQTRRLDHQIQVLQRRRQELESHIETAKSVTNIFVSLLAPLYRRTAIHDVRRMRQELRSLDTKLVEVTAERQMLQEEQNQLTATLVANTDLLEQEEQLHRAFRLLHVRERRLELQQRQSELKKLEEQERLRQEETTLHQQQVDLQKQIAAVKEKLIENKKQQFVAHHQSNENVPLTALLK